jgi:hypothetical protein
MPALAAQWTFLNAGRAPLAWQGKAWERAGRISRRAGGELNAAALLIARPLTSYDVPARGARRSLGHVLDDQYRGPES